MEIRERVVVRWTLDANVIDPDLLIRLNVVVDDHPLAADDRHLSDLPRLKPATLDRGKFPAAERKGHVRHVLNPGSDVCIALTVHGSGSFAENMQDDGDVVRSEIPGDIDVLLEKSQ